MINDNPFWTHDITLFDGTFRYYRNKKRPVRGKLHVSDEKYWHGNSELIPLSTRQGLRSYVMMQPYVIEPQLIMTVAVSPKRSADEGEVLGKTTGTKVEGYQDVRVDNAQAWFYPEDKVIVLWECFLDSFVRDVPLLKDTNMTHLWSGFEQWLVERYPGALRIVTPWMDPLWQPKEYQAFLRKRGYRRGKSGTFMKLLR
jgi:hypothetical protein